jgi:hypothetical protein
MKPNPSIRRRFILAESNSLTIETIQTYRDCPPRNEAGDTWRQGLSPKGTVPEQHLRILKLKGTWRANAYNELVFEATGHKGSPQKFTFKGAWKINNNQQIEYVTEDGRDTLTFKGYWQIPSSKKIVYFLEGSSTSRFEFKIQLESPSLYPKKGQIRYRIGIGLRHSRLTLPGQLLILYGEWKFNRDFGLSFQMDYGLGRIKSIEFGAEVTFSRNRFIFVLKSESGEPLGITLTMTHKFLKALDGQAFVKLKSSRKEHAVEAGISIPF